MEVPPAGVRVPAQVHGVMIIIVAIWLVVRCSFFPKKMRRLPRDSLLGVRRCWLSYMTIQCPRSYDESKEPAAKLVIAFQLA